MMHHNYFVYIVTNHTRTVLYTGVTSNIEQRIYEHKSGLNKGFTKKYNCKYCVYFEHHSDINYAIEREKKIKGWSRQKKEDLIKENNPKIESLNSEIFEGI